MTWYRVNLDGQGTNQTWYTEAFDTDDNGHLWFEDTNGRRRVLSAGHRWTVTECPDGLPDYLEVENRA